LLYQGSKKTLECSACSDDSDWNSLDDREQDLCPLRGQMRLDPEGKLCDKVEVVSIGKSHEQPDEMEMELHLNVKGHSETCSKPESPGKQLQIGIDGKLHAASVG